eukprot:TRINITY_DN5660_c0_g1_i2.p1 TRINITY_DN5660_c0_g1~~TRINITY_DN5660_c0_g1_i2.p1  ORF type:complete len:385 (-),score=98.82 TRINITY_DN5660_c0_g1_i2:206-1360(-)
MIITHSQIEQTSEQLRAAIEKREDALKSTVALLRSLTHADQFVSAFQSSVKKAKTEVMSEEREVRGLWQKFYELKSAKKIVADDPKYERLLVIFVELQSLSSAPASQLNATIEDVTSHLDELRDFLNGKMGECGIGDKLDMNNCKDPINNLKEKELVKRNSEKRLEMVYSGKATMAKENGVKHKNEMHSSTKSLKRTASTKTNKLHIIEYEKLHDMKKLEPPSSNEELKFVESEELKHALSVATKERRCTVCKQANPWIITLKCCGHICVNCFKKRILETEPRVVLNALEAEKKQTSMFACPTHKVGIDFRILHAIFSAGELEKISISALKRQTKTSKRKRPILCADCKGLMEDYPQLIRVCTKHKICDHCYTYFFAYHIDRGR